MSIEAGICDGCIEPIERVGDLKKFVPKMADFDDMYVCNKCFDNETKRDKENIQYFLETGHELQNVVKPQYVNLFITNNFITNNHNTSNITNNNNFHVAQPPPPPQKEEPKEESKVFKSFEEQMFEKKILEKISKKIKSILIPDEIILKPSKDDIETENRIKEEEREKINEIERRKKEFERLNNEAKEENKKIKKQDQEYEDQKQLIKEVYGTIRTDEEENKRIKKIFENEKSKFLKKIVYRNEINPMFCNACGIYKAFPDAFVTEKSTYNIDICAECVKMRTNKHYDYIENNEILCKCGSFYFRPNDLAEEIHNLTKKHLKGIAKKTKTFNIDTLTIKDLYDVCKENPNTDGLDIIYDYFMITLLMFY